jgi:hypothetical protein
VECCHSSACCWSDVSLILSEQFNHPNSAVTRAHTFSHIHQHHFHAMSHT